MEREKHGLAGLVEESAKAVQVAQLSGNATHGILTRSPVASRLSASKASERHGPRYGMRGLDRRPCQEPATEKRFYRAAAPAR